MNKKSRRLRFSGLSPIVFGPAARLAIGTAVVATLAGLAAPASAEGPGWTVNATVKKLVVTYNGGVNVRLSPDLTNCASQSGYGPNFASVYATHPGINRIKADLIAAYVSGSAVSLYLGDSTCRVEEMVLGGW
jgi:hypothetical protein